MNKLLLTIYSVTLILACWLALSNVRKINTERKLFFEQSKSYIEKIGYLTRCANYHSRINNQKKYLVENKSDFVIYFTGKSCGICVESLLQMLRSDYGIKENVTLLMDEEKKKESIINFNDAYRLNYKYFILPDKSSELINEILLIKVIDGEISHVLEYKPEEQDLFKEYFKLFKFKDE